MKKNYYLILGIGTDASLEEIKSAYRRRALELHPDRSGRESEPFVELQEAYAVLSDPQRRRRYDQQAGPSAIHRPPWGPAPEPMTAGPQQAEPFSSVEPASAFKELSLTDSFTRFHPSFEELFDRLWSNFEPLTRPKAEHLESLQVEVRLTPEEARRGGIVRVMIPARATCSACGGRGGAGSYECWRCEGQGALTVEYPVDIPYPPGIRNDYTVRVPLDRFGIQNFYLTIRFRVGTLAG